MKKSILEAEDRFVGLAFAEETKDDKIENYPDFKRKLFKAFESDRGKNATGQFDEDEIIHFFESQECKDKIKENISPKEFKRIYGEIKRGEQEIQRDLPKGVPIKSSQVKVIYTPKKISIKAHTRAGISIKPYNKGYRRWTSAETKFLQVRKAKKITPKEIIRQYNSHFRNTPRSSSSLKTQIFRTKK